MYSVTGRVSSVVQPYGGYVKPKDFEKHQFDDGISLYPEENIHGSLVGMAVDYLTRWAMGTPVQEAFQISLKGASLIGEQKQAIKMLSGITNLDNQAVINACKLVGYDVCFRAGVSGYRPVSGICPDENTIFNILTMVQRCVSFWKCYGPVVKDGFTLEGGYTDVISQGDGDYLTKDTLWDLKVTKSRPTSKHTLQLLIYYIMGKKSIHPEFASIQKLGIFNPRLNIAYIYEVSKIPAEVIDEVSISVIGYQDTSDSTSESNRLWTLNDLTIRYGVSKGKITKDFIANGLPYTMAGRSYRFTPEDVVEWEIRQRSMKYGRKGIIKLPGYVAYGQYLENQLRLARKKGDKAMIQSIRKELKDNGYANNSMFLAGIIGVVLGVLLIVIILSM